MELRGPFSGSPLRTLYGLDCIYQVLEDLRVVDLGSGEHGGEWYAASVHDEVALGAGTSAVYGIRAGLLSPFFAGMLAESTDALEQSMRQS